MLYPSVKILIVEDHADQAETIRYILAADLPGSTIVIAPTIKEAQKVFLESPDFTVIFMDGNMGHETTLDLIRSMRQSHRGPMVAFSQSVALRLQQLQAGCDYLFNKGNANEIGDFVLSILDGTASRIEVGSLTSSQ